MLLFHKSPPAGADKLANVVNMSGNAKQMPALELEAFLEGEGSRVSELTGAAAPVLCQGNSSLLIRETPDKHS